METVKVEMLKSDVDWHLQNGILEDVVFDMAVHIAKQAGKNAKPKFQFVSFGEVNLHKSVVFQFEVEQEDIGDEATSAYVALCEHAGCLLEGIFV